MAQGNLIVVEPDPRGKWFEGYVGAGLTFYPGMQVGIDASVALDGGNRHTFKVATPAAAGGKPRGPVVIVTEDIKQGRTASDSYAAGERFKGYCPRQGDEINLLLGDVAGTGDDHTKGEILILHATTGKFIATTGSPATEPAMLLETITDPTTDTLAWCIWSGY